MIRASSPSIRRRISSTTATLIKMSLPIPPPSVPASLSPSPCPSPSPTTPLPSPLPSNLNILFLHGYTQSGPRFQSKTNALTKFLKKTFAKHSTTITYHFPTAPIKLSVADIPGAEEGGEVEDSYAWYTRSDVNGSYDHMEACWRFVSGYMDEHGPFHFVVGFSQGAALAALISSLLEDTPRRTRPEGFTTSHPPLLGTIAYCGFRAPPAAGLEGLYIPPITAPILHVLGSLDTVVAEERSVGLVDSCENGRENLVWHPGGHYVVIQRPYMEKVVGFMMRCLKETKGDEGKGEEEDVNDMDVPF